MFAQPASMWMEAALLPFTCTLLCVAACGVFLIVMVSALFSIRQVIKVDPAVVFRG